jgi:mannose-6-phosphate isomerase-like protein (cupin superfamily)
MQTASTTTVGPNYLLQQLDSTPVTPCPGGTPRRAFAIPGNTTATVHLLDVSVDAQVHYHRHMTEIYVVLEGEGHIELDGELVPVRPMSAVMIKPGCRHRAVGNLRVLNIPVPAFDPADEWFD